VLPECEWNCDYQKLRMPNQHETETRKTEFLTARGNFESNQLQAEHINGKSKNALHHHPPFTIKIQWTSNFI
jgi:hypothetical protein